MDSANSERRPSSNSFLGWSGFAFTLSISKKKTLELLFGSGKSVIVREYMKFIKLTITEKLNKFYTCRGARHRRIKRMADLVASGDRAVYDLCLRYRKYK
ncbi:hypothetical protein A3H65_02870 [Candidatus Giovannonibacteria bacterium RIFCSPLOWO2_02_FULL_45_14]|uniref:Uncharacterized protein n=1 Tax=Candidatus Giovannonibacteria bacterium RIFCSPLOWO2_12_FULL_44_15 TaxID=1798364 RepID=A0A1F5Y1I6_9BACT|nr:MAG: hypothetical protein A3H65_02870 [Candidatus Giovannonibacteria bacterium RIFCSPLOWO2_02_FULL_45_14]OGF93926.1 MAG: hypothetical protein A3G54_03105 [Candidatus Giovannonibacteria bacterium RIFCSPLOWO2_12_FULL_44_15]